MASNPSRRPARAGDEAATALERPLRPRATRAFAGLFKVLGDETRLEIVALLAAQGKELCVCEIEAHFDLGQPTVSHHLRLLREAGILRAERRGTWVYYQLERALQERVRAFCALLPE